MADLRAAFDETVAASDLIEPVDKALVAAGAAVADQIDFAVENLSGQDVTKAMYLMPHLVNILRELMASPSARMQAKLGKGGESGGSKLGNLRSIHGGKPA